MRALNHAMGELISNHSLAVSSHEEVQIIRMKGEILFNELLFYLQIVLVDELKRTKIFLKKSCIIFTLVSPSPLRSTFAELNVDGVTRVCSLRTPLLRTISSHGNSVA